MPWNRSLYIVSIFFFCFLVLGDHLEVELKVNTVCHSVLNSFSVQLDDAFEKKYIANEYFLYINIEAAYKYDFHLNMYF